MANTFSGWCNTQAHPDQTDWAHRRCSLSGCPCACHIEAERFECSECGRIIAVTTALPKDADGDPAYVHIDAETGHSLGEECR